MKRTEELSADQVKLQASRKSSSHLNLQQVTSENQSEMTEQKRKSDAHSYISEERSVHRLSGISMKLDEKRFHREDQDENKQNLSHNVSASQFSVSLSASQISVIPSPVKTDNNNTATHSPGSQIARHQKMQQAYKQSGSM